MYNEMKMRDKQTGLTIVELMIAMALGLIVTAAVAGLFLQNKAVSVQSEQINYMQDNGRYALKLLSEDLRMVNYWGGYQAGNRNTISINDNAAVATIDPQLTAIATNCGPAGSAANWDYLRNDFLAFSTYVDPADAPADFQCIDDNGPDGNATAIDANTSVLLIKRTRGVALDAAADLTRGAPYIRTNKTIATIHRATVDTADPAAGFEDWQFQSRVYFIEGAELKRWSLRENPADNTTNPVYVKETVASGIEVFHVVWGIDNTTPWTDGVADFYTSTPDAANLRQAVSAKIYILARGSKEMTGYTNDKTYNLGDLVVNPNDGFYRKVYSTTVLMKNTQAMLGG